MKTPSLDEHDQAWRGGFRPGSSRSDAITTSVLITPMLPSHNKHDQGWRATFSARRGMITLLLLITTKRASQQPVAHNIRRASSFWRQPSAVSLVPQPIQTCLVGVSLSPSSPNGKGTAFFASFFLTTCRLISIPFCVATGCSLHRPSRFLLRKHAISALQRQLPHQRQCHLPEGRDHMKKRRIWQGKADSEAVIMERGTL